MGPLTQHILKQSAAKEPRAKIKKEDVASIPATQSRTVCGKQSANKIEEKKTTPRPSPQHKAEQFAANKARIKLKKRRRRRVHPRNTKPNSLRQTNANKIDS